MPLRHGCFVGTRRQVGAEGDVEARLAPMPDGTVTMIVAGFAAWLVNAIVG